VFGHDADATTKSMNSELRKRPRHDLGAASLPIDAYAPLPPGEREVFLRMLGRVDWARTAPPPNYLKDTIDGWVAGERVAAPPNEKI
jgi:hypothetical protein